MAVDVPFLLGLDIVTNLRVLLDFGNNVISSCTVNREAPITRKQGHLYAECLIETVFYSA